MPPESQSGAARSERAHCHRHRAAAKRRCDATHRGTAPALHDSASSIRYTSGGRGVAVFAAPLLAAALLVPTIGAFGCASATPQRASLDAAFARIQVHEAAIERARLDVQRPSPDCGPACGAARSARLEQDRLCRVARDVADPDALTRCSRAQGTVASLNAQAARRCGCR
jgi:hypothetical protein